MVYIKWVTKRESKEHLREKFLAKKGVISRWRSMYSDFLRTGFVEQQALERYAAVTKEWRF
jgi:hypothetical protein